ncbi:MAG TPA: VanZ family protein [Gammaproteobacteria bacterium]
MKTFFKIDPRLRKKYWWLVIGVGWGLLILAFSMVSMPYISMPDNTDKLYHAFAYCVLMGWWLQLFPQQAMRLLLVLIFILFGVSIEVLQSLQPLRHFDILDMLANSSGVILAWLLGQITLLGELLYRFEKRFL